MGTKKVKPVPQHAGTMLFAVFIIVTSGTSLASYFSTVAGFRDLPFEQQVLVDSLGWVEIGLTFFLNIAVFTGAVWLFLLRRAALHSFLCAFGASVVRFIWTAFSGKPVTWGWGADLVFIGALLAICVYVWRLDRSEVLS